MDLVRVKVAVGEMLDAFEITMDPSEREATAERVANLWAELLSGVADNPVGYLRGGFETGYTEMVALRDIPFYSLCEHHLLPFFGKIHIAYLPGSVGRLAGASNLAKVVLSVSRRLQIQERLTQEIAVAISDGVDASGVLVLAQAEHLCMTMKDRTDLGSTLVTVAALGSLSTDIFLRNQAILMLGLGNEFSRGQ